MGWFGKKKKDKTKRKETLKKKSTRKLQEAEERLKTPEEMGPGEGAVEQWTQQAGEKAREAAQATGTQVAQQVGPEGQMTGQVQETIQDVAEAGAEAQAGAALDARTLEQQVTEQRFQAEKDAYAREHEFARQMNQQTAKTVLGGVQVFGNLLEGIGSALKIFS